MYSVVIKSFAKINMYLDVLGKREDGYHDIETIMQHLELHDDVLIRFFPKDKEAFEIKVSTNRPYLPTDARNLAYRAAEAMKNLFPEKIRGGVLRIDIKKRIPVAAGLAGGSGNCASVLLGLNYLFGLKLTVKELCAIGEKLGSDVPFCIMGQAKSNKVLGAEINGDEFAANCALAKGTGTDLTPLKGLACFVVLSKPPIKVSTKEVYMGIDAEIEALMKNGAEVNKPCRERALRDLAENNGNSFRDNMMNLLEVYTLKKYPVIIKTKELFYETGNPLKVLMSGSGPTVFAIYDSEEEAAKGFKSMKKINRETFLTKTLD